jgi:hypothetical protein
LLYSLIHEVLFVGMLKGLGFWLLGFKRLQTSRMRTSCPFIDHVFNTLMTSGLQSYYSSVYSHLLTKPVIVSESRIFQQESSDFITKAEAGSDGDGNRSASPE